MVGGFGFSMLILGALGSATSGFGKVLLVLLQGTSSGTPTVVRCQLFDFRLLRVFLLDVSRPPSASGRRRRSRERRTP